MRPRSLVLLLALALAACAKSTAPCRINSDCGYGRYCQGGYCKFDCRADYDCAAGSCQLETGRCLTGGDGGTGTDGGPQGPGDGGPPDMTRLPFDLSGNDPPDLSMPSLGRYGDPCAADAECESGVCARDPFSGERECAGACKGDSDCRIGDNCIASLHLCAPSDIGNTCKGPADCRQGACLGGGGSPQVCTRTCGGAADCPAGWSCSPVQGTRVCVPLEGTPACQNSAQCWYGTTCSGGRCLGACRGVADCPLGHTCSGGLCAPPSSGRGGQGDPCTSGGDCRSGLCADTCVDPCGVTADRGQFCGGGWGCNPVDSGGGKYILVCLGAGRGGIGGPCVDNASCGSALCVGMPGVCSRFCNDAPCPPALSKCAAVGLTADGVALKACSK